MLATIGFLTIAVLLILFAYTFNDLVVKDGEKELRPFALAYLLVALAFLMWGIVSMDSGTTLLSRTVGIGDALLLAASLCVASAYITRRKGMILGIAAVAAAALLYVRINRYYPHPSLDNGVLFFNTQRPVAVILSAIIVIAWLPACMKVARIITAKAGLQRYYQLYVSTYALAIISAALFIEATRRSVIIASFTLFGVSVLLMLISNLLALNTVRKVRHAAK